MSLCAMCGIELPDHQSLCAHSHMDSQSAQEDWAASNRTVCDFIHRHILPKRLSLDERNRGELWPEPNFSDCG